MTKEEIAAITAQQPEHLRHTIPRPHDEGPAAAGIRALGELRRAGRAILDAGADTPHDATSPPLIPRSEIRKRALAILDFLRESLQDAK